jgi:hypothetical protein
MGGGDGGYDGEGFYECDNFEEYKPEPKLQIKDNKRIDGKIKVGYIKKYRRSVEYTLFKDGHEEVSARLYKINKRHYDLVDISKISEDRIEKIRLNINSLKLPDHVKKEALEQIMEQNN